MKVIFALILVFSKGLRSAELKGEEAPLAREAKRLVYINNQAYDINEDDQRLVDGLYMRKAHVRQADFDDWPNSDVHSAAIRTQPATEGGQPSPVAYGSKEPSYRFVADRNKQHLIEQVNKEELKRKADSLRENNTKVTGNQIPKDKVLTVQYEYTKLSLWDRIWGEVSNIGSFFSRELFTDFTSILGRILRGLLDALRDNARRTIEAKSKENLNQEL